MAEKTHKITVESTVVETLEVDDEWFIRHGLTPPFADTELTSSDIGTAEYHPDGIVWRLVDETPTCEKQIDVISRRVLVSTNPRPLLPGRRVRFP